MKIYLLLFSILLIRVSVASHQDLEFCGFWTKVEDSQSVYSEFQPGVSTEYTCKITCIAYLDCLGVDVIEGVSCRLTVKNEFERNRKEKSIHWTFTRKGAICPATEIDCYYAFPAFENKYVTGGKELTTAKDIWDCKKACVDREHCAAVDWWPNELNGIGKCYLHYAAASATSPVQEASSKSIAYHLIFKRSDCVAKNHLIEPVMEPEDSLTRIPTSIDFVQSSLFWGGLIGLAWLVTAVGGAFMVLKRMQSLKKKQDLFEEQKELLMAKEDISKDAAKQAREKRMKKKAEQAEKEEKEKEEKEEKGEKEDKADSDEPAASTRSKSGKGKKKKGKGDSDDGSEGSQRSAKGKGPKVKKSRSRLASKSQTGRKKS